MTLIKVDMVQKIASDCNASMLPPADRKRKVDGPINRKVTFMPEEAKELGNGLTGSEGQAFFTNVKVM